ncbi:hypothetical protein AB0F17_04410 [Nonomuraea sp. NPDC026600]
MQLINGVPLMGALVAVAGAPWARRRHVVIAGARQPTGHGIGPK